MKKLNVPPFPEGILSGRYPQSVSIIIDNYNYASFIREAIESALAQTHPAQVIVVDDGSTDESREIISSYATRIETVLKTNGGHASALNAGFAMATGDIIAFLDSDDMMEPNAVATLLMEWLPQSVLAHYPMTMIDSNNRSLGIIPPSSTHLAAGDVRSELLRTGNFSSTLTSGLAFARSALERVMPVPEKIFTQAADGYLIRSVAFLGLVQRIDARLSRYRIHPRNDSDPWNSPQGCAAGFRKKIRYSLNQFTVVKQSARKYGLPLESTLGDMDADYWGYRLFSLLVDPDGHPFPDDRRSKLFLRYIVARWYSAWSLPRRLTAIAMAALAAISNPPKAMKYIHMIDKSDNRPAWLLRLASLVRKRRMAVTHEETHHSPSVKNAENHTNRVSQAASVGSSADVERAESLEEIAIRS